MLVRACLRVGVGAVTGAGGWVSPLPMGSESHIPGCRALVRVGQGCPLSVCPHCALFFGPCVSPRGCGCCLRAVFVSAVTCCQPRVLEVSVFVCVCVCLPHMCVGGAGGRGGVRVTHLVPPRQWHLVNGDRVSQGGGACPAPAEPFESGRALAKAGPAVSVAH
jgi:hypothetical protein